MLFDGHYKNGKFVPDSAYTTYYNEFISRCENGNLHVSIEISKAKVRSDKQAGLFRAMLSEISKHTGYPVSEIVRRLSHLRIVDETTSEFVLKDFSAYTTEEFSKFIDEAIDFLNDFYNLNLHVENVNGKAKVCL